jgi:predicted GIY-YIG superfamily endonuclease
MFYVYFIVSQAKPDRFYIGFSCRPEDRLEEHNNAGKNPFTARFTPWLFANVISFRSKQRALNSSAT